MSANRDTLQQYTNVGSEYVPYDQFLIFGDSITQGSANADGGFGLFPALSHDYVRRLDIINRGFSGYNTANARIIFPQILPPPEVAKVRFLMIFFGANDSVSDAPSQRRVSIEEYKANLIEIVTHPATRLQNPRTMLVTPPPINEYQRVVEDRKKGYHHIRRTARTTKKYAEACLGIAKGLGVVGVDIWSAFMREAGWEEGQPLAGSMETPQNPVLERLMYDGLHLSADGYRLVHREVSKAIREHWQDQTPENLAMNFPSWEDAPR